MAGSAINHGRLPAAERRDQLLDVTTDLVSEQGFPAVTMSSVADRAGVSRPIVYEHFGDLPGLLNAVVEREMGRAAVQITETAVTDLSRGSPRDLLLESLGAYLCAVRDHPTTWRLVLTPPEGAPELLRTRIALGRNHAQSRLARAVEPLLAHDAEAQDAELTARALSAIADEYARLVLTDPERFPPERLVVHARWFLSQVPLEP